MLLLCCVCILCCRFCFYFSDFVWTQEKKGNVKQHATPARNRFDHMAQSVKQCLRISKPRGHRFKDTKVTTYVKTCKHIRSEKQDITTTKVYHDMNATYIQRKCRTSTKRWTWRQCRPAASAKRAVHGLVHEKHKRRDHVLIQMNSSK